VPGARHLARLDFDTMLEFSNRGAGVINVRAVELARKFSMPLVILNSLRDHPGTRVEGHAMMEHQGIVGVTANDRIVGLNLTGLALPGERLASFLTELSGLGLELSGLHVYTRADGRIGLSFLAGDRPENRGAFDRIEQMARGASGECFREEEIAAVSIVGAGVIPVGALATRAVGTLARASVTARSFSSSTTSLTLIVPREQTAEAVAALHRELVEAG
jgi:aspartate kinase